MTEQEFAERVDALAADPARASELLELLREDHSWFDQRGTTAVVRMRGWVLASLTRTGVSDEALLFVLEELDTGRDPYLVAAAARALRSRPVPLASFAPFLLKAIENIRYHDEPVTFDSYGEYASTATASTAVDEVVAALAWLGPAARSAGPEIEALRNAPGLPTRLRAGLDRVVAAIGEPETRETTDACCELPAGIGRAVSWVTRRRSLAGMAGVRFEDHDGRACGFDDVFRGRPTIVAFFYTRCDNPLKCSLTIAKMARVQKMLDAQGLGGRVRTMAITYDPAYDVPDTLKAYGENRAFRLDDEHRLLRATQGAEALQAYFAPGVNFVGSLINRHRIELFVLDGNGRIVSSFERMRWDEQDVVDAAAALVEHPSAGKPAGLVAAPAAGTLASIGVAFFPKCPMCWAAYLSVFGIAGLDRVSYTWMVPLLFVVMAVNVASVWWRSRRTGRWAGLVLVIAGAIAIASVHVGVIGPSGAWPGMVLTLVGSVVSAFEVSPAMIERLRLAVQPSKHVARKAETPP